MNKLYALLLALSCTLLAVAQDKNPSAESSGRISGRIIDSLSKETVEYASVSVHIYKNTKASGGGMTNNHGSFEINGLTPGSYTLSVTSVGYHPRTFGPFALVTGKSLAVGDLRIGRASTDAF